MQPAPSSPPLSSTSPLPLSLLCSPSALRASPHLALSLLARFTADDGDDEQQWSSFIHEHDCQLIHTLATHFTSLIPPATTSHPVPPPPSPPPSSAFLASVVSEVADIALYSALLHLLFIFSSLSPSTVCPILIQHHLTDVPLIISTPATSSPTPPTTLSNLLLLRLQLLALTISSYPPSPPLPPPHPLVLHQTLTLLALEDAELRLASSACLFLLLSTADLPSTLPVLLHHPALPAFLSMCLELMTPGNNSPFLPLALSMVEGMAGWVGVKQGKGEGVAGLDGEVLVQLWDAVCEVLEGGEGEGGSGGEGAEGEQPLCLDGDVVRSAMGALSALLTIPQLQSNVTLHQYSTYKRNLLTTLQQGGEATATVPASEPSASTPSPPSQPAAAVAPSSSSHNPFNDDEGSSASLSPAASALASRIPFTADDCLEILSSASPPPSLPPALLVSKVEALEGLLNTDTEVEEWVEWMQHSSYQLLLVLAFLYTQDSLPASPTCPSPSDLLLSTLLSLSSLSVHTASIASAALSHPSFLSVLVSRISPSTPTPALLQQLRILYLVYTSPSSPTSEATHNRAASSSSSPPSSSSLFPNLFPLLTHSDELVVTVTIYLLLLSHRPSSPPPSSLLSFHSSYAFQSELLHLLNRGAVPVLDSSPSLSTRSHPPPALLTAALHFLCDLIAHPLGLQWVYSTDLTVLIDVLCQTLEDRGEVSEEEEADAEKDVVVLTQRALLELVQRWEGWRTAGVAGEGYKERDLRELMRTLTEVDVQHRASGPRSRVVLEARKRLAAHTLLAMTSRR